ncbi:MAG: RNA polymerase sigma factor [Thiotrichaceae bacterium]|nr:RNA polymerase sigma factor [Thiotrichaceae bacterium]
MKFRREHILDELLVLQTQDGDMKAFTLLVKRWQPAVLRQAYRLTRDNEAALDVAQEAWQAIAKGIYKLRTPGSFKTWMFKIVSNKSANWIKYQQKQRQLKHEADVEMVIPVPHDEISDVDLIKQALSQLPIKSRTILSMFYLDNYSVSEVAEVLSLSHGTVKSRLFYARKTLKEKFENKKFMNHER